LTKLKEKKEGQPLLPTREKQKRTVPIGPKGVKERGGGKKEKKKKKKKRGFWGH